jgi:hypothetical protein
LRLYLFRLNEDIEISQILKVADNLGRVLGIDFTVFGQPISKSPDELTVEDLLMISDAFLERGEPVVALVFARSGVIDDEAILGQGSEPHRGAWVRWRDDVRETTLIALHELGHVCDADHCTTEGCLMFPTYGNFGGKELVLRELFCDRTLTIIQSSWVFTRLSYASQERAKNSKTLKRVIEATSTVSTPRVVARRPVPGSSQAPPNPSGVPGMPTFPDWNLADSDPDEFVRLVKEHFRFSR